MLVPTQAVRPMAMAQGLTAKPTKPEAEDCPLLPHFFLPSPTLLISDIIRRRACEA